MKSSVFPRVVHLCHHFFSILFYFLRVFGADATRCVCCKSTVSFTSRLATIRSIYYVPTQKNEKKINVHASAMKDWIMWLVRMRKATSHHEQSGRKARFQLHGQRATRKRVAKVKLKCNKNRFMTLTIIHGGICKRIKTTTTTITFTALYFCMPKD